MNKVFRVSIGIVRECDLYVVGESSDEVRRAVEADDIEGRYFLEDRIDVSAYEVKGDEMLAEAKHAVLDGQIVEIKSPEWQEHLKQIAESPPPVPDTVTLPLFGEDDG